jgi:hypothetical protein
MIDEDHSRVQIGVLWRGDRTIELPVPRPDRQLGPLFDAFAELPVDLVMIPFQDDALEEVKKQVWSCDGVLVWVNPIQDGVNRAMLDPLLKEASAHGIYVSADPAVIQKLGTKEVLFRTRELSWGSDTDLYSSSSDFKERFPGRLAEHGRLVLKQGRGNGGDGVWKVEVAENSEVGSVVSVRVQDAQTRDGTHETMSLVAFMSRCDDYFTWSGCLVDQEFQDRLADGMLRCYFTHDEVVGFARQWPQGLLDVPPGELSLNTPASVMEGPDGAEHQSLRIKTESEWVPQLMSILGLSRESLPVIWDADFLYGPKDEVGDDTYVLCEINTSAVWPFPKEACDKVARAAFERVRTAKALRI